MIKTLAKSIREYKLPSILTVFFMIGEVIIEVLIPFITADLVNNIKAGVEMSVILKTGLTLALMAVISLCFGCAGAISASKASTGFAKNLRRDMFQKFRAFPLPTLINFRPLHL